MGKKASILRLAEEASKVQEQAVRMLYQASEKEQASRVASRWAEKQGAFSITVQTQTGEEEVLVKKSLGNWAIHRNIRGVGWTVTHIPTGLRGVNTETFEEALEVLDAIKGVPALLKANTYAEVARYRDMFWQFTQQYATPRRSIEDIALGRRPRTLNK